MFLLLAGLFHSHGLMVEGLNPSLTQLPISIINIIISIIGGVFTLIVGRNILYKYKRGITVICWFFVVLWSFGFIQQLLGTPFEKMVCSLVLLLGVISNLRMAIEKK